MAHIVKIRTSLMVRVQGNKVTQVWLNDEEMEPVEVLETGESGDAADVWTTVAEEDTAPWHPAALVAVEAPWPRID